MRAVRIARYIDALRIMTSCKYCDYGYTLKLWRFSSPGLWAMCEMFYVNRDLFLKGKFE